MQQISVMGFLLLMLMVVIIIGVIAYLAFGRRKPSGPEAGIRRFLAQLERQQAEAASAVHRVVSAWKDVRDRIQGYEEDARRWGDQARQMMRAGDEAGARDRLERQVGAEHAAEALRVDLQALEEARTRADRQYALLKQQYESAQARFVALSARQAVAGAQEGMLDLSLEERRAADAYAQLQEGVAAAEARAAATAEVEAAGRIYEDPAEIDRRLGRLRE